MAIAVGFLGQRLAWCVAAGLAVGVVAVIVLVGWSPIEPNATTILAIAAGLGAPASYAMAGNYVRARMAGVEPIDLATGSPPAPSSRSPQRSHRPRSTTHAAVAPEPSRPTR